MIGAAIRRAAAKEAIEVPMPDREGLDGIEAHVALAYHLMAATPAELRNRQCAW